MQGRKPVLTNLISIVSDNLESFYIIRIREDPYTSGEEWVKIIRLAVILSLKASKRPKNE